MKNIFKLVLVTILFLSVKMSFSQVDSAYEVGTWANFKECAISYTFDDGCAGQFSKAIPIFDEYNYKLTLFTVTSWVGGNWSKLEAAAENGHEVANHTASHPNFNGMEIDKQETELSTCNNLIDSKISSQQCLTMAYPYCVKGNDALHKKYFIAARGCQGFIEGKTPGDFMNVSSVICGDQGSVKTATNFNAQANSAASKKGWLVYLIHGVDGDGGYSSLSSNEMKSSLEYLKNNDAKFWVSTFGDVARYIKERNCVTLKESSIDVTSITLAISDTLSNNEWYNFPLSIRRALPEGWGGASVTQNGVSVIDSVLEINGKKYIQFNVVPDAGSVVITKETKTSINLKGSLNNELKLWRNANNIHFTLSNSDQNNYLVSIFNLNGERIYYNEKVILSEGNGLVDVSTCMGNSGLLLFHLSNQKQIFTKKFLM